MTADQLADLRAQHRAFSRERYDGHNRRSGLVSMARLGRRRARRRMRRWLAATCEGWAA